MYIKYLILLPKKKGSIFFLHNLKNDFKIQSFRRPSLHASHFFKIGHINMTFPFIMENIEKITSQNK